jgi:hypothetical protein
MSAPRCFRSRRLSQPHEPPAPDEPFADLPKLLALAAHHNVAVKISGACTLSHEQFPYKDIWDPLGRVFDAFGFDRCMWGTDWTRAVGMLTYEQGVEAFRATDRLSDSEGPRSWVAPSSRSITGISQGAYSSSGAITLLTLWLAAPQRDSPPLGQGG